jgi:hypothetical protein
MAVAGAAVAAAADWYVAWSSYRATAVWCGRRRGEAITGRLLRRSLSRRGYKIMDGRAVRGQASIDHLIIGPGGVWIVDNEAWGPDIDIDAYGGKLFFGEKSGAAVAKGLVDKGTAFAELLSREAGLPVEIEPLLVVHGGKLPRGGLLQAEGLTLLKPRLAAKLVHADDVDPVYTDEQIEVLARTAARELQRLWR